MADAERHEIKGKTSQGGVGAVNDRAPDHDHQNGHSICTQYVDLAGYE